MITKKERRGRSRVLHGAAKSLDISGSLRQEQAIRIRNRIRRRDADYQALRGDWQSIATDFDEVRRQFEKKHGKN